MLLLKWKGSNGLGRVHSLRRPNNNKYRAITETLACLYPEPFFLITAKCLSKHLKNFPWYLWFPLTVPSEVSGSLQVGRWESHSLTPHSTTLSHSPWLLLAQVQNYPVIFLYPAHTSVNSSFNKLSAKFLLWMYHLFPARTLTDSPPSWSTLQGSGQSSILAHRMKYLQNLKGLLLTLTFLPQ